MFWLMLLKIIWGVFWIPPKYMCIIVIVLILSFAVLAIRCVYRSIYKSRKAQFVSILFAVYLTLNICKLVPYIDYAPKTVVPELVATMDAEVEHNQVLTYYSIKSGPFIIDSVYHRSRSFSPTNELDWVIANTQETDKYTYLISFGCEVSEVTYEIWDSYDYAPAPWSCAVMHPDFTIEAENDSTIYIYRIDKVLIEAGL